MLQTLSFGGSAVSCRIWALWTSPRWFFYWLRGWFEMYPLRSLRESVPAVERISISGGPIRVMTHNGYAREREAMVESQILARGVHDARVADAMRRVPRHCFVPATLQRHAYEDRPLEIGWGQTISQPYMVALMTSLLALQPEDRVLEIGTGSGYQSAILSLLAAEVFTIERKEGLAEVARDHLKGLGYCNVTVLVGDGTLGCPAYAPFDAILVTAGGPSVPESLKTQLKNGGRLVCPVGPRSVQRLVRLVRLGQTFHEEQSIDCVFVPLIGQEGWEE